jgi:hypothetical protein
MSGYVHELKTDHEVFDAVARGDKTHEIRRNDRNFLVGDTLILRETRYTGQEMSGPEPRPLVYTGRTETRVVSHVLEGYGLQPGWVILSFAPTQGADARPVAIYLGRTEISTGGEAWVELDEHERASWMDTVRIVYATRDAVPSDDAKRLKQLEHALVYVAHSMHSEPQYMLAEGITLGDVSFVRVKVADVDVSVELPESVARAMYDAAKQATAAKDDERRAAIAPRNET